MPLDEITTAEVAKFRAYLLALEKPRKMPKDGETTKKLGEKRINNILAVLSKALKYADDADVLAKSPKIGMFKIERPEVVPWDFEQYARILVAAKVEREEWYAAVCLAGEAGLRVGEIKELRWREDVDMIARTITVSRQTSRNVTGTPKGRTRRTVPMTATLHDALKRMSVIREGYVVRNVDGRRMSDGQAIRVISRVCRKAGLPQRLFHTLRHYAASRIMPTGDAVLLVRGHAASISALSAQLDSA
jgi:integrase